MLRLSRDACHLVFRGPLIQMLPARTYPLHVEVRRWCFLAFHPIVGKQRGITVAFIRQIVRSLENSGELTAQGGGKLTRQVSGGVCPRNGPLAHAIAQGLHRSPVSPPDSSQGTMLEKDCKDNGADV